MAHGLRSGDTSQPGLARQERWRPLVHHPAATGRPDASQGTCRYVRREPVAPMRGFRRGGSGAGKPERGVVGRMDAASPEAPALTVALDMPSAHVLADQASIIQDLQFVMDCCKRLLAELARPEEDRDAVVPLALWSSALVA